MKAIVMNGTGGREMLEHVERPDPVVGPGRSMRAASGVARWTLGCLQPAYPFSRC